MNIEWRDVRGFEGLYKISNGGVVFNCYTGRTLFGKIDMCGYPVVTLINRGIRYSRRIHRLVAEVFIDNSDHKPLVHHKDGDRENNHVDNLEWVTSSENQILRYEDFHMIEADILERKRLGYNHRQIAEALGINRRKVQRVVNGH